jgi:diacylglycerol kinase family enzyme
VRAVDVGEVNNCIFINNCSVGSYAEAVRARDRLRREHGRGKWVAMAIASFRVFRRLRRFRVRIETPEETLTLRTPFVFIGNNRYSGRLLHQNLRPRLDEGRLAFYTTRAKRRFTLLRLAWHSLTRSLDEADALESHFATAATLTSLTGEPLPLALDGELVPLDPPLHFRIRPAALHVIAPAAALPTRPAVAVAAAQA